MVVQLQIVTGFLGSGKTTLVRHLIEGPGEVSTGVVVGEFAEEGFDGRMIEASGATVRQISASGVGQSAKSYLPSTRSFVDEGRFTRVILETSGVTEIAKVTEELWADPVIKRNAIFAPTIVVVDAGAFAAHDQFFPRQFWAQLDVADIVAVNKTDKVPGERLDLIKQRILARNPEARVQFTYQGQIQRTLALSIPYDGFTPRAMRANWSGILPPDFEAFVYRSERVCFDQVMFGHILLNLPGGSIARFKGVLRCWDKAHCINGLPGQLDWDNTPVTGDTRIAFIGLDLKRREEEVTQALDAELERQREEVRRENEARRIR
ncbi:MAG: GTP-binding protein [Deltaproteobacteria bacterium]|nr:GTP-binding protein [Deltaproteobacteria bacterium]